MELSDEESVSLGSAIADPNDREILRFPIGIISLDVQFRFQGGGDEWRGTDGGGQNS